MILTIFFIFIILYFLEMIFITLRKSWNYAVLVSVFLLVLQLGSILQIQAVGDSFDARLDVSIGYNFMIELAVIINLFVIVFHKSPTKELDELDPNVSFLDSEVMICSRCGRKVLYNKTGICLRCRKLETNERIEERKKDLEKSKNETQPEFDLIAKNVLSKYSKEGTQTFLPGLSDVKKGSETKEEKSKDNCKPIIEKKPRFCTNCGKEVKENWKYCNYCGNQLNNK